MGVVATQAPLLFHRRVYNPTFRRFIVALITKSAAVFHQNQLVVFTVIIVA
jgi:hypothetical protein